MVSKKKARRKKKGFKKPSTGAFGKTTRRKRRSVGNRKMNKGRQRRVKLSLARQKRGDFLVRLGNFFK